MKTLPTRQFDNQVIYPSSKASRMIALLIGSKILLAACYFLLYDLLKTVHVVHLLFLIKILSGPVLVLIQRPFSSGKRITRTQWFSIVRYSFFQSCVQLLWLFGLSLCGPLRTAMLVEHRTVVVVAGVSALVASKSTDSTKLRGTLCFIVAVLALLFLDHDDSGLPAAEDHPEGQYHHGFSHVFYILVSWIGLADHKGGVLLLVVVLGLQTLTHHMGRHLAVEVGGAKRLHALATLASTAGLVPCSLLLWILSPDPLTDSGLPWVLGLVPWVAVAALIIFVLDFYVDSASSAKLDSGLSARLGTTITLISALAIRIGFSPSLDHGFSGGLLFSWVFMALATMILSSSSKTGNQGTLVGYSAAGTPLYSFSLPGQTQSTLAAIRSGLAQILREKDSKSIFYFLCLNLVFTMVELGYGLLSNSLGLISDGFHMLFDCSALLLGLTASLLAKRKPTKTYPYGYGRAEVLSGFINGLFLIVVALMVLSNALKRILDPPKIYTEKLLTVSVLGLLVNCFGILVFRHAHTHSHGGGGGGSSHHGHSHGHDHGHSHNANMQGVFLHVLADTLGSVGVIVSSILVDKFGLLVADPICSVFTSSLVLASVVPLLRHSSGLLLLGCPSDQQPALRHALGKILQLEGVQTYSQPHFWEHTAGTCHGSIHVQLASHAAEQKVLSQVQQLLKEAGVNQVTVQLEKEQYFQYLGGMSSSTLLSKSAAAVSPKSPPLVVSPQIKSV